MDFRARMGIFRRDVAGRRHWYFRRRRSCCPTSSRAACNRTLDFESAPTDLVIAGVSYSGAENQPAAQQALPVY